MWDAGEPVYFVDSFYFRDEVIQLGRMCTFRFSSFTFVGRAGNFSFEICRFRVRDGSPALAFRACHYNGIFRARCFVTLHVKLVRSPRFADASGPPLPPRPGSYPRTVPTF